MTLDDKVKFILFKSDLTCYRIHKLTGIHYQSLYSFKEGKCNYNNMPFMNAKLLGKCYDKLYSHKEGVAQ